MTAAHPKPNAVELEIFRHLLAAAAEQMGYTLARVSYSANIKERRDFSCAVFMPDGRLIAQAAHIPVHLGAMPASVRAALKHHDLKPGDQILLNDPYAGGSHLPDVTLVTPVFRGEELVALACNRAHHADVGGQTSGSMALSNSIFQEGLRIPPVKWVDGGRLNEAVQDVLLANVRTPDERLGDLRAQRAANDVGARAVLELMDRFTPDGFNRQADAILDYAERFMRKTIQGIPAGTYEFEDFLDDDGHGHDDVPIRVKITIDAGHALVDFANTSPPVVGCMNCPLAVTASAVYYVFACLAGDRLPHNDGMCRPIEIRAEPPSLVNAQFPAAVVAGNVETSQRIVDVVIGALAQAVPERLCAAAAGTMSSLSLGGVDPRNQQRFTYYETIPGGMGGSASGPGTSAVQTHMTNTRNTPTEALEMEYPLRVRRFAIVAGSGGAGHGTGGDGVVREIEALADMDGTILADRHRHMPYGLAGGQPGDPGRITLLRTGGTEQSLPAKTSLHLQPGDVIRITTPGGGGFGKA